MITFISYQRPPSSLFWGRVVGHVAQKHQSNFPRSSSFDDFDQRPPKYDAFITDATWNALAKRYNQQQLVDVVATVGRYNLVSMLLNSFRVQLEEGVPGFPKGKDK